MKKILLSVLSSLITLAIMAQCTPDFDFGGEAFGVSPDPEQGETFVDGETGVAYSDVIHIKVPSDAGAVNPAYAGFPIDSVSLGSILMSDGDSFLPSQSYGFNVSCNNGNSSPNPCTFLGGQQGCAELSGTPMEPSEYDIQVQLFFYTVFNNEVFPIPFTYDGYTLTIEGEISVDEVAAQVLQVAQNYPNPFSDRTEISVNLPQGGKIELHVKNLIGEEVLFRQADGHAGQNKFSISAQDLKPGIYIYSVDFGGTSVCKRMVVGK